MQQTARRVCLAAISALWVATAPFAANAQVNWGALQPANPTGAYMQGARMRAARDAQFQAQAQMRAQEEARALNVAVGQAVAAGDCERARTLALSAGNFPLAGEAMQICVPADTAKESALTPAQ